MCNIHFFKPPTYTEIHSKRKYLARNEFNKNKKTLIFDLDETLIHCNQSNNDNTDITIPIKCPNGQII